MVPAGTVRDVIEARRTTARRASSHLVVSRSCRIPLDELEWRFSASGGPGGQHANTSNTKAEVRFDVAASPSLGPRQRARLLERVGPTVRVVASDERSQARNRDLALQRLAARLADGLKVEEVRVPTRPRPSAKLNRLSDKRRRSETKRLRGRPSDD
jgi:ribosome-associated protein